MTSASAPVTLRLGGVAVELGPTFPRAVLGRDQETCDLAVRLPAVSRRHAEVALLEGWPHIRDLGSANGTWLDGQPVGSAWARVAPGQTVHVGEQPLEVSWPDGEATRLELASEELALRIADYQAARAVAADKPLAPDLTLKLSAVAELPYRWEGENANGRLLVALPSEDFDGGSPIAGALTFTAFQEARVSSILLELVEKRPGARTRRHVWDRSIVLEGPWRAVADQRVHATFRLDLPDVSSPTGARAEWEVMGLVDMDWAFDVKVRIPLVVRNLELDAIRDALTDLGADVEDFTPVEPGARYRTSAGLSAAGRELARAKEVDVDVTTDAATLTVSLVAKRLLGSDRRAEVAIPRAELQRMGRDDVGPLVERALRELGDS